VADVDPLHVDELVPLGQVILMDLSAVTPITQTESGHGIAIHPSRARRRST
jgi:hypothetical protein